MTESAHNHGCHILGTGDLYHQLLCKYDFGDDEQENIEEAFDNKFNMINWPHMQGEEASKCFQKIKVGAAKLVVSSIVALILTLTLF